MQIYPIEDFENHKIWNATTSTSGFPLGGTKNVCVELLQTQNETTSFAIQYASLLMPAINTYRVSRND